MSRIGLKPITIPAGIEVVINDNNVKVSGKGVEKVVNYNSKLISITKEENVLKLSRVNDEKQTKQLHGTTRALLFNAIYGIDQGFKKELEIVGIGYHAEIKGSDIVMSVGYSHTITIKALPGVKIECKDPTHIVVSGPDKEKVGQVAALIRETRKPEPYLGKGVKYKDEFIARKVGKRATAK